ncbi:MAG TPA: DinB family protein [Terriglobales bacterium]
MSESARIAEEIRLAFEGEAWHGPALLEVLSGVDARTAAARPVGSAHSIWELAMHVATWEGAMLRRIDGAAWEPSDAENFPAAGDAGEAAWKKAVAQITGVNQRLVKAVAAMPDSRLAQQVPGKNYDFYFMLHGAAQHAAYHGGQIALLKRAQE